MASSDQTNVRELRVGDRVKIPAYVTAVTDATQVISVTTIYPSTIGGVTGQVIALNTKQVIGDQ